MYKAGETKGYPETRRCVLRLGDTIRSSRGGDHRKHDEVKDVKVHC